MNNEFKYDFGLKKGDKAVCPLCQKEFTISDETRYKTGESYACSWECIFENLKQNGWLKFGAENETKQRASIIPLLDYGKTLTKYEDDKADVLYLLTRLKELKYIPNSLGEMKSSVVIVQQEEQEQSEPEVEPKAQEPIPTLQTQVGKRGRPRKQPQNE